MEQTKVGQFIIGNQIPGAPLFTVVLIDSGAGHVTGHGKVTQTTNPPLDLAENVAGTIATIVWGPDVQTNIQLTGWPGPGIGLQVGEPNLYASIVLDSEKSKPGVAQVRYLEPGTGRWVTLQNQPVKGNLQALA